MLLTSFLERLSFPKYFIFSLDYTYIKETPRDSKQNENAKDLAMNDLKFVYISL